MDTKIERKNYLLFGSIEATWGIFTVVNTYFPVLLQAGRPGYDVSGTAGIAGFGISTGMLALIATAGNIIGMLAQPLFGAIGSLAASRKKLVMRMMLLLAASLALTAWLSQTVQSGARTAAPLIGVILLWYCIQITWASSLAVSGGIAYTFSPPELRTRMNSVIMFIGGAGNILINAAANATYVLGFSGPLLISAAIAALIGLGYLFVDEPVTQAKKQAVRIKSLILTPLRELAGMEAHALRFVLLSVSVKLLGLFGIMGFTTYQSSYFLNDLGIPPDKSAILFAIYFLGYIVMAPFVGKIAGKIGEKLTCGIGLVLMAFYGVALMFFMRDFMSISLLVPIIGMGNVMLDVCVPTLAMYYVSDPGQVAVIFPVMLAISKLTSIISVPLFAVMISVSGGYSALFPVLAIMPILGFIPLAGLKGK